MELSSTVPYDPDARVWVGSYVPGNGSRYNYAVWHSNDEWYVAFPEFGKSARVGTGNHWSYIAEKLRVSMPDAEVMAHIINTIQGEA